MIWAADARGLTVYTSADWERFSGQSEREAGGLGWLEAVHPDDRVIVGSVVRRAVQAARDFWTVHRVRTESAEYVWVLAGAAAVADAGTQECIGFMGSVTMIEVRERIAAQGDLGAFREHRLGAEPLPNKSPLQMLRDLQVVALAIATEAHEEAVAVAVESCLTDIERQMVDPPKVWRG